MSIRNLPSRPKMYQALIERDSTFEGVFLAGITSTGIFCRPVCPARKPKPENVLYYRTVRDALLAGFRPCKRCRPLEAMDAPPDWLRGLLADVEMDPNRRWKDGDLRQRGLEPSRVRRWFQAQHGMTFHAYQRARRLGHALARIQLGADLNDSAYEAGYESPSGFREAFGKFFGEPPGRARGSTRVVVNRISTPLGSMIAAATDEGLCLLEFADRRMLETQIQRVRKHLNACFVPGGGEILGRTRDQLDAYFAGRLHTFDVPLVMPGSEFQQEVWQELLTIPHGATRSYAEQATAIGRPKAVRAVGTANGDNRIAILVPCHRVVGSDGKLTGYGGQLWRKKALLELESRGTT